MKKVKTTKPVKQSHSSSAKTGTGDFYGSGVRQKVGKMIDGYGMMEVPKSKMKKPPKSLA